MITYIRGITRILLKTALAALVPFIPALVANPAEAWPVAVFTIALAVVIAAATALVSIPDVSDQGWLVAALAKGLRQFGQMIVAATAGAVLLTDVEWSSVLTTAAASAVTTLVIAAVDGLGNVPTLPDPVVIEPVEDDELEDGVEEEDPLITPAGE